MATEENNAQTDAENASVEDSNVEVDNQELENDTEVVEEETNESEVKEEAAEVVEEKLDDKSKEYLDRLQRTIAEFDNFRKRTIKEKSTMYENGAREVLEKMLPVIDNFERAIAHIPEEDKDNTHVQGVLMIYKQLSGVIGELGVTEIEAQGNEFDANLHHAVAHEDSADYGDNEVAEVFQKGYMYKEKVLRHAMVKVVN